MMVLLFGTALFALAFVIHFIVWKIQLPRRQTKVLLLIFFSTLLLGTMGFWFSPASFRVLGLAFPKSLPEYIHISLYFIALTIAYIITYSAIEADSPTLVMVLRIDRSGSEGLKKETFEAEMSDDLLIKPRVRDLLVAKMTVLDGGIYRLTHKGKMFVKIFILYRKLLNAPKGG